MTEPWFATTPDGLITAHWPEGVRTAPMAREVLDSIIEQLNAGRALANIILTGEHLLDGYDLAVKVRNGFPTQPCECPAHAPGADLKDCEASKP